MATPLAAEAVRQLRAYLADPGFTFGLPLRPAGTTFQRRVWEQISAIPPGQTHTYGQLAENLKNAPRAVGQTGAHAEGKKWCWGHSMVIDPWGLMVAQCSDGVGSATATVDLNRVANVRRDVPVAQHHVL